MKINNNYRKLRKQYRKQLRKEFIAKYNFIHKVRHKMQYNKMIRQNSAPDVSSITEHLAFVIDGEVVEVMHCQPKMAAILLSEPEIIDMSDGQFAKIGWKYEDGKFFDPNKKAK